MLDIKLIRENPEKIIQRLNTRGKDYSFFVKEIISFDELRREKLQKVEELKQFRNQQSKLIGIYKKNGEDTAKLFEEIAGIGEDISKLDLEVAECEKKIQKDMDELPNLPNERVFIGKDETENKEMRRWGTPRKFEFESKAHWDLGVDLDILDFDRATKITGARFVVNKGLGARLERAVMNFMLDVHTYEHGIKEIIPPFMVNATSMYGTGQLPKFEEDLFKIEKEGFYLIPTAEVPVTNLHANEILDIKQLPIKYCAYTPCFRSEAGSAGRDTRGIIRLHQFNKVELVRFTTPETSYQNLEELTHDAEEILQRLELPYRVIQLCTGDMGFGSAMTYDIEVWLPSYNAYKEISSCSNYEDFQARRANIKFRRDPKGKAEFVHTLNGSGLAIGRTVAAIMENYQNKDGSITIPKELRKYFNGEEVIK
ncbi:MAG: serine--tRNA ligase [Erysipelotrichales bacterium]|nr:serine--tRNA ligase [Erysipelotrichales bacterium]